MVISVLLVRDVCKAELAHADDSVHEHQEQQKHAQTGHGRQRFHQGVEDDLQFLELPQDSEDSANSHRAQDR